MTESIPSHASAILDAATIVSMHDEAIEKFGGREGFRFEADCPERTLAMAWHAEEYVGAEAPGLAMAGYLMYYRGSDAR